VFPIWLSSNANVLGQVLSNFGTAVFEAELPFAPPRQPDSKRRADTKRARHFYTSALRIHDCFAYREAQVSLGLTLSPDERLILYGQTDQLGSDLMLVDNFH
jgi:hypothetical protein